MKERAGGIPRDHASAEGARGIIIEYAKKDIHERVLVAKTMVLGCMTCVGMGCLLISAAGLGGVCLSIAVVT